MNYFPIFCDLKNKSVLVVGGGEVAERKIRLLLKSHAFITVISLTVTDLCLQWECEKKLKIIIGRFNPELLDDKWFVVAATNDPVVNALVFKEASKRHIFCNAVDDIVHCSSIMPSIVDRSPLVIAISSEGNAPVFARSVREKLESELSLKIGVITRLAGMLRPKVNNMIAPASRRHFWEYFFKEMQSRSEKIDLSTEEKMHNFICDYKLGKVNKGFFSIVEINQNDIESLTLKAIRSIQIADVILTFDDVYDEMECFIRRDCSVLKIIDDDDLLINAEHSMKKGLNVVAFVSNNRLKKLEEQFFVKKINIIRTNNK